MARLLFPALLMAFAAGCGAPPPKGPHTTAPAPPAEGDSSVAGAAQAPDPKGYRVMAQNPAVLLFATGDTLPTGLADVRELARVTTPLGRVWFLFQGRPAANPSARQSLYVVSPGDSLDRMALEQPWHLPGQLLDSTGQSAFYEAQVFAGQVLPDTVGVVWYDRSLMPDGQWKLNTILLNLNGPQPDTLVFFGHDRRTATLQQAFHGHCQILEGTAQRLR